MSKQRKRFGGTGAAAVRTEPPHRAGGSGPDGPGASRTNRASDNCIDTGFKALRCGIDIGADTSPDWEYWRQMPHEVLWKAVALSCNIEPRRERLADANFWINRTRWGDGRQDDRYREFYDRLEIATARISELNVVSLNEGDANVARIELPQFAAWAVSMQWKIPQQLAELANTATKASKPAAKSENLATTERGTVQKIIAGFLAQGYSHEQIAKPYSIAKELQATLQSVGQNLSDDTIVNWIKEAAPLVKPAEKKSGESK